MERLSVKFPSVETSGILSTLTSGCRIVEQVRIENQVCEDPDDDKFLAAALGGNTKTIISGDKHLLDVNGYSGIEILRPSEFLEQYLSELLNETDFSR